MLDTKSRVLRRRERALNDEQTLEVIAASDYAVISTADEAGNPYGTAVNPVYLDGAFYFHTGNGSESRRNANMLANPKVSLFLFPSRLFFPNGIRWILQALL